MSITEPLYVEVGRRIQDLRLRRSLTQEELGRRLVPRVGRASIANLEGGKQRILLHTFLQIAEILECDPLVLLPASRKLAEAHVIDNQVTVELTRLNMPTRALDRIRRQLTSQSSKERR